MAKPEPLASEPKPQSRGQKLLHRAGRIIASSSLPEIMLIASLCIARYTKNSDFSYPSEILLNIVIFGFLVTAVFYAYRLILRSRLGAHVAGLLLTFLLINFKTAYPPLRNIAQAIIPDSATSFTNAVLTVLICGVVFGLVGFAAKLLFSHEKLKQLPVLKFLVFVVCFIFAVQVGKMGLRVWEIRDDLAYSVPASSQLQKSANATTSASKPNVYYLLFDRYASADTLQKIYDFDNTPFINGLKSQGFTVRDNAYANYPFTMQSASSTLAADYHADLRKQFENSGDFQTGFPYRAILNNAPVTKAFQANGYRYNQVSSWWDFTRDNPTADTNPSKSFRLRVLGKNFWLTDLQRDIVNQSVLSPLLLKGLTIKNTAVVKYQLDRNPAQNFNSQFEALETIAKNSQQQTKPQFTFAHVLAPHDPYIFDENGNRPDYGGDRDDNGADEYDKYKAQLTYVNKRLTGLVESIRAQDPNAIIVLQADEGPYPKQFRGTLSKDNYFDPITLPQQEQRQKFGVLAAYYLPGITQEQPIDSSVNAFRFVLNQYLGYQLPLLPDCQFSAGDKFKLYNYQLVTGKLKAGEQPAACNQYK